MKSYARTAQSRNIEISKGQRSSELIAEIITSTPADACGRENKLFIFLMLVGEDYFVFAFADIAFGFSFGRKKPYAFCQRINF